MAARTGKEYLDRLAASRPTVHIQGETLTGGVQDHPAFRNVVRTYAELYDLQHSADHRDTLTYSSPPPVSRSARLSSPRRRRETWSSAARRSRCGPTTATACSAAPATT